MSPFRLEMRAYAGGAIRYARFARLVGPAVLASQAGYAAADIAHAKGLGLLGKMFPREGFFAC